MVLPENDRVQQLRSINEQVQKSFGKLSPEVLNWKPNSDKWSIAEVLEHLNVVGRSYFEIFDKLLSGSRYKTPWLFSLIPFVRLNEKMILKGVSADRRKKMKTFDLWQPDVSNISGNIPDEFQDVQEKLLRYYEDLDAQIKARKKISSPANRMIVYRLDTAFDIIIEHEKRHFNQASEVLELFNRKDEEQ